MLIYTYYFIDLKSKFQYHPDMEKDTCPHAYMRECTRAHTD